MNTPPPQADESRLREDVTRVVLDYNSEYGRYEPTVDAIMHLIAARVEAAELSAYENVLDNTFDLSKRDKENLEKHIDSMRANLRQKGEV